jgi:hypothetical protein
MGNNQNLTPSAAARVNLANAKAAADCSLALANNQNVIASLERAKAAAVAAILEDASKAARRETKPRPVRRKA